MPEYLRCKSGFLLPDRTIVKGGQIVRADDRVVKGREKLFESFDDVESATRAPNERRLLPKRNAEAVVMAAEKPKRNARRKPTEKPASPDELVPVAEVIVEPADG